MGSRLLLIGGIDEHIQQISSFSVSFVLFQKKKFFKPSHAEWADELYLFDYEDEQKAIALAQFLHNQEPFAGVISFTEFGLEIAAKIKETLGIAGNPLFPVQITRNKLEMRQLLNEHGLSVVKYACCNTLKDVQNFWSTVQGPIILKPTKGFGSLGVCLVETVDQLESAWDWSDEMGLPLIVEEYITGKEYSVEGMTINGRHEILAITEKCTTGKPHFVETGHQLPAPLTTTEKECIEKVVFSFLDLVQHRLGPTHTEVRLSPQGPKIIESHTRPGGDYIWEMAGLISGCDMIAETIETLLQGKVSSKRNPKYPAVAIRFFYQPERQVTHVEGLEVARQMPGVLRIECQIAARDQTLSSFTRDGYVLAYGKTVAEATVQAEAAYQKIQFV